MISFKNLKQSVSIRSVLENKQLASPLKRKGHRLIGACPIHQGDNPQAFVVDLNKNLWHCFTGCQAGGDVIELVRRLDHSSYPEIALYLQQLAGIRCASQPPEPSFRPFNRCLSLDAQSLWFRTKGITSKTALTFESGEYHYAGFLSGCVAVRLHDLQGQALGYTGRRLNPQAIVQYGKWKFPKSFPKNQCLYNWHRIQEYKRSHLVVVESPWDVMRLFQLNIPAVALLGLQLSNLQRSLICQFDTIVLLLDGDTAGQRASFKLKEVLRYHVKVNIVQLPDGKDPDDLDDMQLLSLMHSFFF